MIFNIKTEISHGWPSQIFIFEIKNANLHERTLSPLSPQCCALGGVVVALFNQNE
jgi:hypothetical protein